MCFLNLLAARRISKKKCKRVWQIWLEKCKRASELFFDHPVVVCSHVSWRPGLAESSVTSASWRHELAGNMSGSNTGAERALVRGSGRVVYCVSGFTSLAPSPDMSFRKVAA